MSQSATPFALSDTELTTITSLLRKGKESTRKLTRARVLQGLHQQKTPQQLHDALGVCLATVYNVKNRYQQNGLQAAIGEKARPGQPRKVTQQVEAHITQIACSQAPDGRTRWTASLINERLVKLDIAIDDESVRLVLKKANSSLGSKSNGVSGRSTVST
jgi:putative transposase